jgi:flagellar biosynthesis protein FlgN
MPYAEQAINLYRNLAEECDIAMTLVDVLLEEQACLVKLETNRLSELSLKKEGMMVDLEKRFKTNVRNAQGAGFEPSMEGLALWVDQLAIEEPRLLGTYSTLRMTLQQAHRLNTTNGDLVTEQLMGLQQRIAILTAAALADQQPNSVNTYGPKGALSTNNNAAGNMPRAVIR